MNHPASGKNLRIALLVAVLVIGFAVPGVFAQCPAGGIPVFTGADECILNPATIDQYYIPLVIPPVMKNNGIADSYDIAVRQFTQQILPGGIWATLGAAPTTAFPATTVWSYGPAADPTPAIAPDPASQFNYPAYTIETMTNTPVGVRWINDLVDPATGNCLQHFLPIDQTLHWANPSMDCRSGAGTTDCAGDNPDPYTGPVPIVTHVHGAHVDPHSDGYPEAWWLPNCNQASSYAQSGTLFDDSTGLNNGTLGYADYWYRQDQPATTLWYHDHSLGMTRNNVYAGPAGFWLIRGGMYDRVMDTSTGKMGRLPGPAPGPAMTVLQLNVPGTTVRNKIREIPIVIQDRDFKPGGGELWYPQNRARFEDLNPAGGTDPVLDIDFVPDSDVAPIWNPEAFFNVMVVNGVAWPSLDVAQALYRFRFLNGCNSRFLWLKFSDPAVQAYQIGAEQGFLPAPQLMNNDLDGSGDGTAQLLIALAERADVIVDFRGLADGTVVELRNIGPDEPFGGGTPFAGCEDPDVTEKPDDCFEPADSTTSGKVMRFLVNAALNGYGQTDPVKRNGKPNPVAATDPANLALNAEPALGAAAAIRQVSLNELESEQVCVTEVAGSLLQAFDSATGDPLLPPDCVDSALGDVGAEPFGPLEALLGTVDFSGTDPAGIPLKWTDSTKAGVDKIVPLTSGATVTVNVTENPALGAIEDWEIYNFTADAHPIHLHLVRFAVIERRLIGATAGSGLGPELWETGFKDTVISYPGEITTVRALFDIEGLYVWHCHIVEHEDNEMMRPYAVGLADAPAP